MLRTTAKGCAFTSKVADHVAVAVKVHDHDDDDDHVDDDHE
jgi:hypothetical protein